MIYNGVKERKKRPPGEKLVDSCCETPRMARDSKLERIKPQLPRMLHAQKKKKRIRATFARKKDEKRRR